MTDAFPQTVFEGRGAGIEPRGDSVECSVAVRAEIPNTEGMLRPGLFATVRLTLGRESRALLIPEEAVVLQRDKAMVYRLEDQTTRLTEIMVGARERGGGPGPRGTEGGSVGDSNRHPQVARWSEGFGQSIRHQRRSRLLMAAYRLSR